MVYTVASGTRDGDFAGAGFIHRVRVVDVSPTGDYFTSEVDRVKFVVSANPLDAPAGVQVTPNSQTSGAAGSSNGDIFLAAVVSGLSTETTDVELVFVGD